MMTLQCYHHAWKRTSALACMRHAAPPGSRYIRVFSGVHVLVTVLI